MTIFEFYFASRDYYRFQNYSRLSLASTKCYNLVKLNFQLIIIRENSYKKWELMRFLNNNNMKEEQATFQCNTRPLKRHNTVDKVPIIQVSPSKTLPLAVTVIRMSQSPQKQSRIHQPNTTCQTVNYTLFGDKKLPKTSRFKVEQYNDLQGDKVENSKVEKKNILFKIKRMNIGSRVFYKKPEKQNTQISSEYLPSVKMNNRPKAKEAPKQEPLHFARQRKQEFCTSAPS